MVKDYSHSMININIKVMRGSLPSLLLIHGKTELNASIFMNLSTMFSIITCKVKTEAVLWGWQVQKI